MLQEQTKDILLPLNVMHEYACFSNETRLDLDTEGQDFCLLIVLVCIESIELH